MYANDGYRNFTFQKEREKKNAVARVRTIYFDFEELIMCSFSYVNVYAYLSIKCIWFILSMHLEHTHTHIKQSVRMRLHLTHANETRTTAVLPVELLKNGHSKYSNLWAQAIFRLKKGENRRKSKRKEAFIRKSALSKSLAPFTFYSLYI